MKDYREIVPDKQMRLDLELEKVLNSNLSEETKEKIIKSINKKLKALVKETNNIIPKKHQ